jgi:phosphotransferase system enzyme I (PtsI)
MGWRAIRICLDVPELFKTQLRAIFRAASHGKVKIMFPMISSVEEVQTALDIIQEVKQELMEKKIVHNPKVPVGILIEVPSAVMIAEELAKYVDFFSIGTNDLTQYTLAVDRGNQKLASLFSPFHPAVLRLIGETVSKARKVGIPVSMCGEMAWNPLAVPLLIGLGLNELSVVPVLIPRIKSIILRISRKEWQGIARYVLRKRSKMDILNYLNKKFREMFPDWIEEDME